MSLLVLVNPTKLWPDQQETYFVVNTVELVQMCHSGYTNYNRSVWWRLFFRVPIRCKLNVGTVPTRYRLFLSRIYFDMSSFSCVSSFNFLLCLFNVLLSSVVFCCHLLSSVVICCHLLSSVVIWCHFCKILLFWKFLVNIYIYLYIYLWPLRVLEVIHP